MSVVLTHSRTPGESLRSAGIHFGGPRRVSHVLVQAMHQVDQRGAIATLLALLLGECTQCSVGFGQASEAQERQ
ncbi:hypothetical protein D3C87_1578960 [compost metagenome]